MTATTSLDSACTAGQPGGASGDGRSDACRCICCLAILAAVASLISLFVLLGVSKDPTYSVTVTGVAGLDPAADLAPAARPALSPVFNLSVRIDNARNRFSSECVAKFAAATVSYADAPLARGSVPQFCARKRKVRERAARAWGDGVALPQFLRDQMAGELAAGEAAVDVEVRMPDDCYHDHHCSDTVLICSQAKIGGPPAPCRKETAYHGHENDEPAAGSTN